MKKYRDKRITGDSLQEVIRYADIVIAQNPGMTYSDFTINSDEEYGSNYAELEWQTEETSNEKQEREARERLFQMKQEERDRIAYEKLKKRFG